MEIGNKCFIKGGAIGEITGQFSKTDWIIRVTSIENVKTNGVQLSVFGDSNTCYIIDKVDVQPLAADLFKIGDRVKSVLGGGFTGVVTGFEEHTNKVLCLSDKNKEKERMRYAYGITELEHYTPVYEFKLNHKYKDQVGIVYRTVEVPGVEGYMLINDASGTFVEYVLPSTLTAFLVPHGIRALEDLSARNYRG